MPRETAEENKIVREAQKRFKACMDWESEARDRWNADQKFAEGDSDNQFQWDQAQITSRTADPNGARPCLTINKTRQHNLQILNDARQNKAAISIRPTGDGATYDSAKIFEGIVRHIEYRSNATEAYEAASRHQIYGGWGYWRVLTEYVSEDSFDQDIKIQRIANPLSVYLDPDIEDFDGSDARFGFIFRDIPRDRFEIEYPAWKDLAGTQALCDEGKTWDNTDNVRICEYYRKSNLPDTLYAMEDGTTLRRSAIPEDLREEFDRQKRMGNVGVRAERATTRAEVEWFKIAGNRIVDRNIWPGTIIPIVRVIGEETVIDGKLDRKGHTRAQKDPQRMYNFWSSAATEHVALQGKSPFIAPAAAIEGYETYWNTANRENYAVLPWNHKDDSDQPIPAPARAPAPQASTAYMQGMQTAAQELMMVSGQYQAEMGAPSNERSGVAINARQRQGDNATYHYIDHLAQAIRLTGRICIEVIPKIYDTERVIKIMAEDGSQSDVKIDPSAKQPIQKMVNGQLAGDEQLKAAQADPDLRDKVETIFNPDVGRYAVESDIGPAYATRRQEAFAALSDILKQAPDLAKIAGDLLFRAADFPMADEVAERIKRTIPKEVLGEGPPPTELQLQQQVQELTAALQHAMQIGDGMRQKLADKSEEHDDRHTLESYKAETARFAVAAKADPGAFQVVIRQLIQDMLESGDLNDLMNAHNHADLARGLPLDAQQMPPAPDVPPDTALAP